MLSKKSLLFWLILLLSLTIFCITTLKSTHAKPKPPTKSKFYDFSEQLIDGQIKKPTALYTDARQRAQFDRLLSLKKSFLPSLYKTSAGKVFK